jgi:ribonuclease D
MKELADRKGVGWKVAKRHGDEILAALKEAQGKVVEENPVEKLDRAERQKRRLYRENREALKNWRKKQASALELPSERLMHRRHLEEIARVLPATREDLLRTVSLNDWQRENLEDSLLDLLATLPRPQSS